MVRSLTTFPVFSVEAGSNKRIQHSSSATGRCSTPRGTVISVITEAELRFGVARLPHSVRLALAVDEFLLRVEILPWDSAAAQKYAGLRAIFETIGEPMGNLDLMIAAQALAIDAILVSNDRVFRRIKGLRMEDWSKP